MSNQGKAYVLTDAAAKHCQAFMQARADRMRWEDKEKYREAQEEAYALSTPVPTAQEMYRYLVDEVNVQRAFDARLTYPAALSIAMHKAVDKFGLTMEPTRENHDHRHHD